MTIDNQKFLYIENSKIVNGDWVTNTLKTKVDENNNLIKSTKEEYQTNYHISDESIDNIDNNVMARRTTSSWKKHTEKFSLSKTKLTSSRCFNIINSSYRYWCVRCRSCCFKFSFLLY